MSEKLLPHNMDAERGALGSMLIDPEALASVADFLRPADFYRDAHRTIYEVMLHLYEQHEATDYITVCDELERRGHLDHVGGASSITSLINQVPTSGNLVFYAQIVAHKALLRRLIHAAGQIAALGYEEADGALETAEQLLFAIGQHGGSGAEMAPLEAILAQCMTTLEAVHARRSDITGIPTGFRYLDAPLGGLQRSDLVIVAARPGTGKTSLCLNIARQASTQGYRVALFSLEMSRAQLGLRLLSMEAGIDQHRLRIGRIAEDEWDRIVAAVDRLSSFPLWIDDTAALPLASLRSRARRMQAEHGVDLVIVDYLQLVRATLDGKRYQNREQEIAEISRGLKALAKELDVPVLALAQLSRAVEARQSKIPQLSDLRESGSIENEADVVMFIYRDDMYDPEKKAAGTADLIIAKHRNGPVGTITLGFDATQTRFYTIEYTPGEENA